MKCTNKKKKMFSKRGTWNSTKLKRSKKKKYRTSKSAILFLFVIILMAIFYLYYDHNDASVAAYETENYNKQIYQETLPIDALCVASDDVVYDAFHTDDELHASALFQLTEGNVVYAENIHERIYPASTTKIMTIYLALKYGTLTDTVTISENAVAVPLDSSRAGFKKGDQLSLEDLLYSLMLPSGNDSAVAIAEYISGSETEFAKLMNEEAKKIGATNSNFVTAHGYHDEDHYTTAYDLYLIFNECVKYDKFLEIVSTSQYTAKVTQTNGTYREEIWRQSNQYINGIRTVPENVTVIGGKTGTTDEAGSCLILYSEDSENNPYISIVMGAESKSILYNNMSNLISTIPVIE